MKYANPMKKRYIDNTNLRTFLLVKRRTKMMEVNLTGLKNFFLNCTLGTISYSRNMLIL